MSLDDDLLIGEEGDDSDSLVSRVYRTLFGTEREAHVCPACETACEPTHTYDPQRAAFDGGASPAWVCPDCETHYVRERDDGPPAVDLYGRE